MVELRGLKVFTKGDLTIVQFQSRGSLERQTFIGEATEHLEQIVEEHQSKVLVIDLKGITGLPSDMLGVLVGLQHRGVEIRLFNVSPEVQMILEVTSLDKVFEVREGDLSALIGEASEE